MDYNYNFYTDGFKTPTKKEPQFAFEDCFLMAMRQRISSDNKAIIEELPDGTFHTWKQYYGLKDYFIEMSKGGYNFSKLGGYFKGLHAKHGDKILYLKPQDYFKDEYISLLDNWIKEYALKSYKVQKQIVKPKVEIKEEINNTKIENTLIEIKNTQRGRPKGSKNKKEPKPIFMPEHRVRTGDDGKLVLDTVIKALADLVWRNPGLMDGTYLDLLLGLTEKQRSFLNDLFMKNHRDLDNKYWKIDKKGKTNILVSIRKRAGYYAHTGNGIYDLISLTDLANHFGMSKQALQYQLEHRSIGQIIKENKKCKRT